MTERLVMLALHWRHRYTPDFCTVHCVCMHVHRYGCVFNVCFYFMWTPGRLATIAVEANLSFLRTYICWVWLEYRLSGACVQHSLESRVSQSSVADAFLNRLCAPVITHSQRFRDQNLICLDLSSKCISHPAYIQNHYIVIFGWWHNPSPAWLTGGGSLVQIRGQKIMLMGFRLKINK